MATIGGIVAHTGHETHGMSPAIPAGVFLAALLVLGTGLYLDRREDVADIYADAGLGIGIMGVLAAVALVLLNV